MRLFGLEFEINTPVMRSILISNERYLSIFQLGQGVTLTAEDILDGEPECSEYLNMLRSRRLSLGVGSSISAPDLLKLNAVREQGGSAILTMGD